MNKKSGRILLIAAVLFACWLQFPVGMHVKKSIPGAMATCAESGLTEGKVCILCGKVLVEQQEIPATGLHVYSDDFDKNCNTCSYIREVNCSFEFENYRVVLRDENENHKNWRVVVYKLGDKTVENPSNEEALQAIDSTAKTYWDKIGINKILLTEAGNYVLLLKYNVDNGAAIKVPLVITVTEEPKLLVDDDNRITVIDKNTTNKNHTVTAFCLGSATVANPEVEDDVKKAAISAETYAGLSLINETMIFEGGNYVFYLRYETADGTEHTVALTKTLASRPMLCVDAENRLVLSNDDQTYENIRAYVFYLGDKTAADIFDKAALDEITGGHTTYWGYTQIDNAVLKKPGNYVIQLYYDEPNGSKESSAIRVTIQ